MYEAEKKHNESLVYRGPDMIEAADEQLVAKRNDQGTIRALAQDFCQFIFQGMPGSLRNP